MSKNSPRQRIDQIKDWLKWRESNGGTSFGNAKAPKNKFSKADHYKQTRERYGSKKSN